VDQEVDAAFIDDLRNFGPDPPFDLAALNILRGRDFGLPHYNAVRQFYGLPRLRSFADFNDTIATQVLPTLYTSIDDMDLYVGGLLEKHHKGLLGPTFHAIIKDQFRRLRDGDRYWYENVLSGSALDSMRQESLSKVIMRNTNITSYPTSAFMFYRGSFTDASLTTLESSSFDFVPGAFSIKWSKVTAGQIQLTMCHKNPGWFAIGFGSSMAGSEILMVTRLNGVPILREMTATGNVEPTVKSSQSITISDVSSTEGCTTAVRFSMAESSLSTSSGSMIFAYSSTSYTFGYHGPNQRGVRQVNILENLARNIVSVSYTFKVFHGISMGFVYLVLYPIGVYIAGYHQDLSAWVEYHQLLMSMGLTQSLYTVFTMMLHNDRGLRSVFVHKSIGVSLVIVNIITFLFGTSVKLKNTEFYIHHRRRIHKILGYLTVLLGFLNCYFGIEELNAGPIRFLFIAYILVLLLVAGFVIRFSKKTRDVDPTKAQALPLFEWDEVLDRVSAGSKWLVINGFIYDVENFMGEHPGGAELLEGLLGTDCTEQFGTIERRSFIPKKLNSADSSKQKSGGSGASYADFSGSIRPNLHVHRHSRFAHHQLSTLAVGKLKSFIRKDVKTSLLSDEFTNTALSAVEFIPIQLTQKQLVVHNSAKDTVFKCTFRFERIEDFVEFQPGDSVMLMATRHMESIQRPYTPIHVRNVGQIEFIIKAYPQGKFSNAILRAKPGTVFKARGPIRHAVVHRRFQDKEWTDLLLLCTGTGITPMLLLIDYVCGKGLLKGKIVLLCSFQTDRDIIDPERLQKLDAMYAGQVKVFITVGSSFNEWVGFKGPISQLMISKAVSLAKFEFFRTKRRSLTFEQAEATSVYHHIPGRKLMVLLCGTATFLERTKAQVIELEVPYENVTVY
jgi:NAD(P)H-flavin reductase